MQVLILHNRYRVLGGEERAVGDLGWLAREHLGATTHLVQRDSSQLGRVGAAQALLAGGIGAAQIAGAVRSTGAEVVHAHNLLPSFGWRALQGAQAAGARTVLHLHNYRAVCAVGTCVDPAGQDCTRCHARDTRPGLRLNCRGTGSAEAATYAMALSLHQKKLFAHADKVVVPSATATARLRELGAPLPDDVQVVGHVVRSFAPRAAPTADGPVLLVSRLAREKGVEDAIDACAAAGMSLVVAGDGPQRAALEKHAAGRDVTFLGRVDDGTLARLRREASAALVCSRAEETYGLVAVEAMAAGLPVVATASGALRELRADIAVVPGGDVRAMAAALRAVAGDVGAGEKALRAARRRASPEAIAPALAAAYGK